MQFPHFLFFLNLLFFPTAHALDAKEILKKVQERASPPSERALIKMTLIDSEGGEKERRFSILRKNVEGSSRALIRISEPADLKGLALLSLTEGYNDEQWLFLPSNKQSRRIVGTNRKGKFLDSDITYEDLRASTYDEFKSRIVKETEKTIQIESVAKLDIESSYGKILTWISKPEFRLQKVEYYDTNLKLFKQAEFKNYKKIGKSYWRAQKVHVTNVKEQHQTELVVLKVSVDPVDDNEVSHAALEE